MSDNKTVKDNRDRTRVDSNDPNEVEYLHSKYPGMTHQEIIEVIKKYGPLRKDIEAHLTRS